MIARNLRNRILGPLLMLLMLLVLSAGVVHGAEALDALKAEGLVGERADGYLGLVQGEVPASAKALVEEINGKRRAQYQRIAGSRGVDLNQVEALAGRKILANANSGEWIFVEEWRLKR